MKNLNIVIVTHYWRPHNGGIESVSYEQAKRLVERGHKVTIISSNMNGDPAKEIVDGITIIRVKAINFLEKHGVPWPIFHLSAIKTLKQYIRSADIINVHGHPYISSLIAGLISKKQKKPLVLTQHNTYIDFKFPFNLIEKINDATLGLANLKLADKIITVSKETQKYVYRISNKKSIVLYNGVDHEKFTPECKTKTRAKLNLPKNKFIVFCLRRLSFKNGIDLLLECAKSQKEILFLIGGSGPDRKRAEKFIIKNNLRNVILLGFVKDEEVHDYFRSADLFVLPSKTGEGFPMAILESFACGVPVVATRTGGQIEIVKDNITGLLSNPNSKDLGKKIDQIFKNKSCLKKMSVNCRKIIDKDLNWENNVDKLIKIYEDCLK